MFGIPMFDIQAPTLFKWHLKTKLKVIFLNGKTIPTRDLLNIDIQPPQLT